MNFRHPDRRVTMRLFGPCCFSYFAEPKRSHATADSQTTRTYQPCCQSSSKGDQRSALVVPCLPQAAAVGSGDRAHRSDLLPRDLCARPKDGVECPARQRSQGVANDPEVIPQMSYPVDEVRASRRPAGGYPTTVQTLRSARRAPFANRFTGARVGTTAAPRTNPPKRSRASARASHRSLAGVRRTIVA
jgi:hypothetical protein